MAWHETYFSVYKLPTHRLRPVLPIPLGFVNLRRYSYRPGIAWHSMRPSPLLLCFLTTCPPSELDMLALYHLDSWMHLVSRVLLLTLLLSAGIRTGSDNLILTFLTPHQTPLLGYPYLTFHLSPSLHNQTPTTLPLVSPPNTYLFNLISYWRKPHFKDESFSLLFCIPGFPWRVAVNTHKIWLG